MRGWLLLTLLARLAPCDAGKCAWRATRGCDPNGPRLPEDDLRCTSKVPKSSSGYCECPDGTKQKKVACKHDPFKCSDICEEAKRREEQCAADPDSETCSSDPEDEAAAGGKPPVSVAPEAQSYECIAWRQTHDCNPDGKRSVVSDKSCETQIETGTSGYCECKGSIDRKKRRVRLSTCDHPIFDCASECQRAAQYACIGWRQTRGCSADGERNEQLDVPCDKKVPAGASGYCECGGGRRVPRPPGCSKEEQPTRCDKVCARGMSPFDVLGVDEGAPEGKVKQAFRKLSVKLHPDKAVRSNPNADKAELQRRFEEVRSAYDAISDADSRALYEMQGFEGAVNAKKNEDGSIHRTDDAETSVEVSLTEAYSGVKRSITVKRRMVCRGCKKGTSNWEASGNVCTGCSDCPKEVKNVNVQLALGLIVQQQQEVESDERCKDVTQEKVFDVEPGLADGELATTFARAGEQKPGMIPGDIKVKLHVRPDDRFVREGSDLTTDLRISLKESLLGFNASITHFDGHTVHVSRRGVTSPYARIKVSGEGMPVRGTVGGELSPQYGDLHLNIKVRYPKSLSEQAEDCVRDTLPG